MSEASRELKIVFPDFEVLVSLKKHFSPTIFTGLILKVPFTSFAYRTKGDVLVKVDIRKGDIQKIKKLEVGDVYYCMVEDAIGFVLTPKNPCLRTEIKIGEVTKGLEKLENIKRITPVKVLFV